MGIRTPLRAADIEPGSCVKVKVDGREIAIFNVDGQFYATQYNCTHMGGPLCDGSLSGSVVTCPWHGSQFDVTTGDVVGDPATESLTTYPLHVKDGVLYIGIGSANTARTA